MAQEAINRSILDTNSLRQSASTTGIDNRQQQQQQILHQHFSHETTANTSHTATQTAGVLAAAVAAAAAANGPPSLVVGGTINNAVSIGPVTSVLNQAVVLATSSGQQQQQSLHDPTSTALSNVIKQHQQRSTNEAHIPPLLGVAPLGPSPLHKDHQLQFQMMEAAYYHLPTPSDSEKLTTYFHRTPVQTPPHYPQVGL